MHLGAVTYNVLKDWDLETIIRNLESAGFEAVELRTGHKHGVEPSIGSEERVRIRRRFEASKIRLLSYGTTCEFHSPDAGERQRQLEIARQFVVLAHDTGAWGIKVRPNALLKQVPPETTIRNIAEALRELGDFGAGYGVEIWVEVHGQGTSQPAVMAEIMRAARHENVGVCWNSNPTDIVNGSVKPSFELLKPWIRNVHINELANDYPWRELFALLRQSGYERYTLMEAQESKEPERFLRWYRALWRELVRPCG
ncbi:MAG: sugar phosphate isomerase/epimerase family protein [Bryobacterales bacterium]|nr:sugar phosphate isomerase/epimerase [Bryobacteraceae bacterium]MDW8355570.1 sugar phosphate isomerase/epimerase family protein [Bryobacterales bacterium]